MNERVAIRSDAVGYVFRTDCSDEGWSYIGQSTRLEREHVDGYYGSGFDIKEAIARSGTDGITKRILATATSELALHYLEMLHIAEARAAGVTLLNGDFGGPRPFPTLQRFLWEEAPDLMVAAQDPELFHRNLADNRSQVEDAIERAMAITPDEFYVGYERDLLALMDLSHACPSCSSPAGAVCRTNSKSSTKPHNPCINHQKRPLARTQ